MESKSVVLPHSGVTVEVTEKFNKTSVSDFLSSLLQEETTMQSYRANPEKTLGKIGIQIKADDIGKINPEDLHTMRDPNNTSPQVVAAVAVAVAVMCYPSKVNPNEI